jgi:hypothetical protein
MLPGSDPSPPKPVERVLRGAGYLGVGFAAVWLLILPPSSIGSDLGRILTVVWCGFLLAAIPAAVSAFAGRYRGEYASIPWFGGAIILAVLHSWIQVFAGSVDITPRALTNTALVLFIAARFVTLHQLVKIRPKGELWTRRPSK